MRDIRLPRVDVIHGSRHGGTTSWLRRSAFTFARNGVPMDWLCGSRLWSQGRNTGISVRRIESAHGAAYEARLQRIEMWLRRTRRFGSVSNIRRAAERIDALALPETFAWLNEQAYREKHQPQETYRGGGSPRARLTADQVSEIRERYSAGGESFMSLASEFGVSGRAIGQIVNGETWRHA